MPDTSGPSSREGTTEVLVVGAGPTGLLLAAELARRGVDCRVVEQAACRRTAPKAINLHTRTLEIMDDLGIADEAVAIGNRVYRLNSYSVLGAQGKRLWPITRIDLSGLDSRFPFTLTLAQPETERLIEQRCATYGVQVEWGTRFTQFSQEGGDVFACLEKAGGQQKETVRAAWLVGCDGIDSTVRNALGLHFEGKQYPNDLLCADVRISWDRRHDEAHVFLSKNGTLRCMPIPGDQRWRIVADIPVRRNGDTISDSKLEQLQALVNKRGVSATLEDMTWTSKFNIYRYFSPRYLDGRAILVGDAAHVHSPLGAQGMNLGLQDSYNLAWKLSLVLRGMSHPGLLQSYQEERQAIARGVLRRTDRNTRLIGVHGSLAQTARNMTARTLLRLPPAQRRISRGGAQLSMNYRHGRLVLDDVSALRRKLSGGPVAGDRAPDIEFGPPASRRRLHEVLHGTGYVLLLFQGRATPEIPVAVINIAQAVRSKYPDNIRVLVAATGAMPPSANEHNVLVLPDPGGELHQCWHADTRCLYLVRPDGYIGYRAIPASASGLTRYLESIFGPIAQTSRVAASQP